jgi:uncharacterized protein
MRQILLTLFFFITALHCDLIETFYGPIEVDEPVILELISHPYVKRLKHIHQYGVSYYDRSHTENYNRYDHSLGVFAILRLHKRPLEEQIAGLLHDVSHTVFSHVGDWIFDMENQEKDYQNSIHVWFLQKTGIAALLKKYGYDPYRMIPSEKYHPALEQPLPNLCADRIDYNIQGAYFKGFITKEEAHTIVQNLYFDGKKWISYSPKLMSKLVASSLYHTRHCWGGPRNHIASQFLAEALKYAVQCGTITYDDIHFGIDDDVWQTLIRSADTRVQVKIMPLQEGLKEAFRYSTKPKAFRVQSKFRGINPWVVIEGKIARLTDVDSLLKEEFFKVKREVEQGWTILLTK